MNRNRHRLLYVVSEFMYGSKVRQLCDLVDGLNRDIFDVEIAGYSLRDEAWAAVQRLGVPIHQINLSPPRHPSLARTRRFLRSPLILRKGRYDLVHSLSWQSLFIEPLIIKVCTHAKYVYTKTSLAWDNHRTNWMLKSRLADQIVSISQATDRILLQSGLSAKVTKIFNGIDTQHFREDGAARKRLRGQFGISEDAVVFGCAAQFIRVKDHPVLLQAFRAVRHKHDQVYLLLCGADHRDEYYRVVVELATNADIAANTIFLGTMDDMPAFYSAIDCFVLPSRSEGLPYVFIEAMSCGRPTIGCRILGTAEIIVEGQTGYACEVGSARELASHMVRYVEDRSLARKQGMWAREQVKDRFSKEAMVAAHEQLYLRLLSGDVARNGG